MTLPLALCIIYAGIIFGASSVPGDRLPELNYTPDYVMHAVEYMILGALLAWWGIQKRNATFSRALWQATFIGSLYGLSDEFHQYFVPNRVADPRDWVADTFGVVTGAMLLLCIWMYVSIRRQKNSPS